MQDSEKNCDVIKIPIRLWRIPFHYYQSGGGSRFYKYFDDVRALVGMWAMWAMAHPLFENLLNKGPFKIFFSKNSLVLAHPLSKCRRGPWMTSHYFDSPAYSGELTISDYYVVEL